MSCQNNYIKNAACSARNGVSKVASRSATVARNVAQASANYNKTRRQAIKEQRQAIKKLAGDIKSARKARSEAIGEAASIVEQEERDYIQARSEGVKQQKGSRMAVAATAALYGVVAASSLSPHRGSQLVAQKKGSIVKYDKNARKKALARSAIKGAVVIGAGALGAKVGDTISRERRWEKSETGKEAAAIFKEQLNTFSAQKRQANSAYRKQVGSALRSFAGEVKRTQGNYMSAKRTFWREALRGPKNES